MSLEAYRAHQGTMRTFLDSQGQVIARLLALENALKAVEQEKAFSPSHLTAPADFARQSPHQDMPVSMSRYTFSARPSPAARDKSRLEGLYLVVSRSPGIATSLESVLREKGALAATLSVI